MKPVFVGLLALTLIFLVGCGSQELYMCSDGSIAGNQEISSSNIIYVCPDGYKTKDISLCDFEAQTTITKQDAENNAIQFVKGYVADNGWTTRLVNVFSQDGNWYAQIIVSKPQEDSYQTTVEINGEKGMVSCDQNCDYI